MTAYLYRLSRFRRWTSANAAAIMEEQRRAAFRFCYVRRGAGI